MTSRNSVDKVMERILRINWQLDESRVGSQIALLREYLRCAALWTKALDCTDEWPFFDIAAQIFPMLRADEAKIKKLRMQLTQSNFYLSRTIKLTCEWFVHWAVIKDKQDITRFALPDPYEHLIMMYERGGRFSTEHGFFNFVTGGFPIGTWDKYYNQSPDNILNAETLDRLDYEYNKSS